MAKSMTGYGKFLLSENSLEVSVEIKSVNNKNRDIRVRIPCTLNSLELDFRKILERKIERGYVELNIGFQDLITEPSFRLDLAGTKAFLKIYQEIEELTGETNLSKANLLARNNNVFAKVEQSIDRERYLPVFEKAINNALREFDLSRLVEGENLKKDLSSRIDYLCGLVGKIERLAPSVPEFQRKKLLERVNSLLDEKADEFYDGQRVAAEIAIFADKADITEEITRLYSHLDQFQRTLDKQGSIGKNLDFLVQEILRETNTIGSKANFLEITKIVVEMKTTIEKIREQVQNIE